MKKTKSKKIKVLVLGGYGLLGNALFCYLKKDKKFLPQRQGRKKKSEFFWNTYSRHQLEVKLQKLMPDCIVNCIALKNIEYCESHPMETFNTNVRPNYLLVESIKTIKNYTPHLLFISSDMVYSGHGPHEENAPKPINVYALTKLLAEAMMQPYKRHTILRTNFIGKSNLANKKSFSDWLVGALKTPGKPLFSGDVKFSPLHIATLCKIIKIIILRPKYGVFNLGSHGSVKKKHFAKIIKKEIFGTSVHKHKKIERLKPTRPKDMSLNSNKIQSIYKIKIPSVRKEIRQCIYDYKKI